MSDSKAEDVQTEGSANGDKIRVRFIFANRDGVTVEVECSLSDTVNTMKLSLISNWPQGMVFLFLPCSNLRNDLFRLPLT